MTPELKKQLYQALQYQQNEKVEEAIKLFQTILKAHPLQPDALHGLGVALCQKKNFTQAIPYFQKAIQAAPYVAEFHNNAGNAYKALNKVEPAFQHYKEALRLKDPYPEAHNNLGALFYRLGNYKSAIMHFQKSIRMNPTRVETHFNLANSYIQLEQWLNAVAHYEIVLKNYPTHVAALQNLGITYCALKQFLKALPLLEKCLELDPNNTDTLFHLGIIYGALAKTDAAKNCYLKILKQKPQEAQTHHNLATLYLQLSEKENALTHFKEAYRLQSTNLTAKHMIDALTGITLSAGPPYEYTQALFNQYAYNYDAHVKEPLRYQVPALLRQVIAPFAEKKQIPWKVLDLGCGTGLCAPYFADVADALTGVDFSANMLEVAKARGGYQQLFLMDALSFLTKQHQNYQLIISADVFVYFGNLKPIFGACYTALQPNGLFCFSVEQLKKTETQHPSPLSTLEFELQKTGRIAHYPRYIHTLSKLFNFKIEVEKTACIRYQEDQPIIGNIYVLRKMTDN